MKSLKREAKQGEKRPSRERGRNQGDKIHSQGKIRSEREREREREE